MRQSAALARYRDGVRDELKAALTKNETERGYSPPVIAKQETPTEADLADLAKRIQNEGPIPVSDRLKSKLRAPRSFVEGE